MYSDSITERELHALSKQGVVFVRRSISDSIDISEALVAKHRKAGFDERGVSKAVWSPQEMKFMRSEAILCAVDFNYWLPRYGFGEMDSDQGGGIARIDPWPSQLRTLELIAKQEEINYIYTDKYGFCSGIRVVWHKTRQQGATQIARLINVHRMCFQRNTRCILGSLDEDRVHEAYTRDHVILDNLPFYLAPALEYDVKDAHLGFDLPLKSRIVYQAANQRAGIGTGQKFDMTHLTEVALWPNPERIHFDLEPGWGRSKYTFVGLESTANGKWGYWYEFSESVRHKKPGFEEWVYSFTPWYINASKNRLVPRDGWEPRIETKEHAALIERTSIEFAGRTIRPSPENMFWWETQYLLHEEMGNLHFFLSNYPATPEESFQFADGAAFPVKVMQKLRANADVRKFMLYEAMYPKETVSI